MNWEILVGRAMQGVEKTFTAGWSLGELAYSARRPWRVLHDAYRQRVLEEIERKGFYQEFPGEEQELRLRPEGMLVAPNPYVRIGPGPAQEKIVAQMLTHARPRARRALVVCHCYGLPLPRLMQGMFGLGSLEGYDVIYNIMNHHYLGSFATWPGFGLMSVQMSRMVENVRSAAVGLRSLVRSLRRSFGYEEVAVLGYSIGGQLAMHTANAVELDRMVLYCPVTSVRSTVTGLGLMPVLRGPVEKTVQALRRDFDFADLEVLDPLRHRWRLPPEDALVIVQSYDAMVAPGQMDAIRQRYPGVRWMECPGTHTWPARRGAFHDAIREHLRG